MTDPCPLVIISWWSNCLALACLDSLDLGSLGRDVYVVQVGKSPDQQRRFRELAPAGVKELPYAAAKPAEHSRVIHDVALRQLSGAAGLWFIDHDVMLRQPLRPWLETMDAWLADSISCLCLPPYSDGPAVTQPAFWISPCRWPRGVASLDPIPFRSRNTARRPDLFPSSGELRMPLKDTLVQARDDLLQSGQATMFPIPFPPHVHLGGLSLFTGPTLPPADDWARSTVNRFTEFFESCPVEWLAAEEPILLRRCGEFRQVIGG